MAQYWMVDGSVVDPHHIDADPDSTYHPDADPDADPDSDFIWCGSGCGSGSEFLFDADADPDPDTTFHPDADPVVDPSFQIKAQTIEKALKYDHIPYTLACHLQIDVDPVPDPAYHFVADPDPDFYSMLIRKRIRIFIWCGCGSGSRSRFPKWCGSMRIEIRTYTGWRGRNALGWTQAEISWVWDRICWARFHNVDLNRTW